jgi:hypothetical protein
MSKEKNKIVGEPKENERATLAGNLTQGRN